MAPRRSQRLLKVTKTKKVVEETVNVTVTRGDEDDEERVKVTETESLENDQETEELGMSEEPEADVARVEIPVEAGNKDEPQGPKNEEPLQPPRTPGAKGEQRKTVATEEEETEEGIAKEREPEREAASDGTLEKEREVATERERVLEPEERVKAGEKEPEREISGHGELEKRREETVEIEEGKKATEKEKKTAGKKRKRRFSGDGRDGEGYQRYVLKVLRQVHPEMRISAMAMTVVNMFVGDMFERIAEEAARLGDQTQRRTMSAREIQAAVRLVLPGELSRHAVAEGSKAVKNYVAYNDKKAKKPNI